MDPYPFPYELPFPFDYQAPMYSAHGVVIILYYHQIHINNQATDSNRAILYNKNNNSNTAEIYTPGYCAFLACRARLISLALDA